MLERNTKLVIIDSVIGYFAAMGSADVLLSQLHELMTFLTRQGVLVVLCGAQEGFMSIGRQDAVDVSYLSDAIVVLSFFESDGQIRRAVAAVKKKHGPHLIPGRAYAQSCCLTSSNVFGRETRLPSVGTEALASV